jgi:hypothetical protein
MFDDKNIEVQGIKNDLPADLPVKELREKLRRIELCIVSCTYERVSDLFQHAAWICDVAKGLVTKNKFS